MTDRSFVKQIAKEYKVSQKSLMKYLDIIELGLKTMVPKLEPNQKIKVCDLTFSTKIVKEHLGRNLRTKEECIVPDLKRPKIKISLDWIRLMNIESEKSRKG